MTDIEQLLEGLKEIIRSPNFPDAATLAHTLDLDISDSRITKTKAGNMGINGARLSGASADVGLVCGITPRREIWILFDNPWIPYHDVKDKVFGANQRLKPSKFSSGFGILFESDGLTCGFTVSSPEGGVDGFFCEESK